MSDDGDDGGGGGARMADAPARIGGVDSRERIHITKGVFTRFVEELVGSVHLP